MSRLRFMLVCAACVPASPLVATELSLGSAALSQALYHDVGKGPPVHRVGGAQFWNYGRQTPSHVSPNYTPSVPAAAPRPIVPVTQPSVGASSSQTARPVSSPAAYRYPYNYRYYYYGPPRHYPFGSGPYTYNYGGYTGNPYLQGPGNNFGPGNWGYGYTPGNPYAPYWGTPAGATWPVPYYDAYDGPFSGVWTRP